MFVALATAAATASALAPAQAEDNPTAGRASVERRDPAPQKGHVEHDLDGPFSKQQEQRKKAALEQVLAGDAEILKRGGSNVVKLDSKKYVELGREKTDKIFTILVEFGDEVDDTTLYDPDGADGPEPPSRSTAASPARSTTR